MITRVLLPGLVLLTLLSFSPARPATPFTPPATLTLRINGLPVATDTLGSRLFLGADHTLRLNVIRADDPDGEGLTILIDRFPLAPGTYAFQEILSGHNRDASYRYQQVAAYSKSCPDNPGVVKITAVDTTRRVLTGTYHCQVCESGRGARRFTMTGAFRFPYEEE
ncbi:hypothetical protein GCM10022408_21830 [Hymenobacter fastidiosus]|uniref:Uncharacterized protein n=1 Tax=Hymenobacter fastidiosus TaxID=486264 RepID=A0ABP7SBC8_9BACT